MSSAKYVTIEVEKMVLASHVSENRNPSGMTFPMALTRRTNLIKRSAKRKKFMSLVNTICGAERRKIWKQLKKDFYELQQHLKVA